MRCPWKWQSLNSLFVLTICLSSTYASAATVDEVHLRHFGYNITISETGLVRVDFVLNQQGVSQADIEMSFSEYPKYEVREFHIDKAATEKLFSAVTSPEFMIISEDYLAPEGTFAYQGHRVIFDLELRSNTTIVQQLKFDSSRKQDWPKVLLEAFDEMFAIVATNEKLPLGPFLD